MKRFVKFNDFNEFVTFILINAKRLLAENFKFFLDYMEKFWVIHKDVDLKDFKSKCMKFYKDKTYQRVDMVLILL